MTLPACAGGRDTPKVLIIIATDQSAGPGRAFFNSCILPAEAGEYILCNFDVKGRPVGQFIEEARRRQLPVKLLNQRMAFDPTLVFQARRIAVEQGINIVQTHGYKTHVIGFLLRTIWRMPWIAFSHGYTDDNWKVRLYNRIDRAILRRADRVITVSDSMRALLVRGGLNAEKIRLVYNAIESTGNALPVDSGELRRLHGISADRTVVGVIGRLNPEKGQMVFLAALKQAIRRCPQVLALLIGDGQDRERLERYCQENGLTGHVVFTGYRENIADYYRIIDLLVLRR